MSLSEGLRGAGEKRANNSQWVEPLIPGRPAYMAPSGIDVNADSCNSECQQFMPACAFSVTQSAHFHMAHMFAVVALAFPMQQHMVRLHIG
jgi:hypothetical protein